MSEELQNGCVELMVDRHVRNGMGRKPALIEIGLGGDGTSPPKRVLSYQELMERTTAIAAGLPQAHAHVSSRISPMRIALTGSATLETVCHWLGAMRAGHQVFLVHPDMNPAQHQALLESYRPQLIWRDATARASVGKLLPAIEAGPGEHASADEAQAGPGGASEPDADIRHFDDARPALVLASSGSTDKPKLCVHSHRAFWYFEKNVTRPMWKLHAADRVLASGGPYFSFGLQGIHPPLSVGAAAVLLPRWNVHADFLRVIAAERVSVFLAVPTLFHLLQSRTYHQDLAQQSRSLRLCLSAGERLPEIVRQRWETHTGVPLCDSIGTTETFAPYLSEIAGEGRGLRAVQGFDYEMQRTSLVDPQKDAIFKASLRSRCMMLGIIEGGELKPAPKRFATNDLFVLRNGAWNFVSRLSERVKVSGYWTSPQELEEFLLHDPRVLKAAAVAIETPEGLHRLRAFVVLKQGTEAPAAVTAELLRKAREQLRPKALCPDLICPVADLSSTPTGKLKRVEVRQRISELRLDAFDLAESGTA